MTITDTPLDAPLLNAAEEVELALAIEAGLYAEHLLAGGRRHDADRLGAVARLGRQAWERMWLSNLRLVMLLASAASQRHGLDLNDLFQDGCIALASAMQRFDARLGYRFGTLAHEYLRRAMAASCASRCGALEGPPHRLRVRQQLRGRPDADGSARSLAKAAGVTLEAVNLSRITQISWEEAESVMPAATDQFEGVEQVGTDFLGLLEPTHAALLRLRFGIGCRPANLKQIGRTLRLSSPQVRARERAALAEARAILAGDRCVLPAQVHGGA